MRLELGGTNGGHRPSRGGLCSAPSRRGWLRVLATLACVSMLAACDKRPSGVPAENPQAMILRHVPRSVSDRMGWAVDIYNPMVSLKIRPTPQNVCAVIAVIEQESSFKVNPPVANMPKVAMTAIDERAEHAGVPLALVHSALGLKSSDGRTYDQRIASARTEKDLSDIFDDLTAKVPLGNTLFKKYNPIHTRGPMQVNVSFANQFVRTTSYPYKHEGSIENELFTRRGSLYFGIAHLLAYDAAYDSYLYRFADFNAGQYASRNAAFQNAVAVASRVPLTRDGALIPHDSNADSPGMTELAIQMLARKLNMNQAAIRSALQRSKSREFEQTPLYQAVFALADKTAHRRLPRAMVPQIELHGPKITRKLTTEWYARRVNERFQRCTRHPGSG